MWWRVVTARFIVGDSLTVLRTLPAGSVDLVLTSPPFLALRSYLPADHPDKRLEVGAEATPGEFIDSLLDIVEECRRVLAPHGSLCVELGDTYSGSGGGGGDYLPGGMRDGQQQFAGSAASMRESNAAHWRQKNAWKMDPAGEYGRGKQLRPGGLNGAGWPLDKSMCLIPELLRISMAYGQNPFSGREIERWRVRNVVRWCRPNPPVGALGDKFRPATSDLLVACTSAKRYFDLDAVREPPRSRPQRRFSNEWGQRGGDEKAIKYGDNYLSDEPSTFGNPAGAPPLDYWEITTQPYKGSHYATWPTALCVKPIQAMAPERVCLVCGKPSERIVKRSEQYAAAREAIGDFNQRRGGNGVSGSRSVLNAAAGGEDIRSAENITVGWTDCGHNSWRPGVVLDPFAGSGTTLLVATGHGRDAVGIDLDERNADLARERLGMFLEVEHHAAVA